MKKSSTYFRLLLLVLFSPVMASCASSNPDLFPPAADAEKVEVQMVRHGWHVGLILPVDEIFEEVMPAGLHLSASHRYIEIGWGDRDYYMDPSPGLWTTIKGGLFPTRSVIHLAAYSRLPLQHLERIEIRISAEGYRLLLQQVAGYFTTEEGEVLILGDGLYGDSRFYAASPRYHLFQNSNKWAVRKLRHAGLPVRSAFVITASQAVRKISRHGAHIGD
ncbi:MAG: DUF2459 domain-containing protein [Candidatus Cyclonatronum sp.]|uniref:DUF2459 domain-containing protein n=1 Tax=Cyclonatronum sp. TaxID=3024185 RepID=UPI0025C3D6C4|nr:DUF2459 domain-containing protein [Cyclonatronum sp.]MCH8486810.1 DUF2459 domain-containing protein [Cyclonatronum sp.]